MTGLIRVQECLYGIASGSEKNAANVTPVEGLSSKTAL